MEASSQLTDEGEGLGPIDRSFRSACTDIDLHPGDESVSDNQTLGASLLRSPTSVLTGLCGSPFASSKLHDKISFVGMGM